MSRTAALVAFLMLALVACGGPAATPRPAPDARDFLKRELADVSWYDDIRALAWVGSTLYVVADVSSSDARGICTALTFHDFTPEKVRVINASDEVLARRDEPNVPCSG